MAKGRCPLCQRERDWWIQESDPLICAPCRRKEARDKYGLKFYNGEAEPTQAFWRAWREDRDAVKRQGFKPVKKGSGRWKVVKLEAGEKERVRKYIDERYAKYTKYIGSSRPTK